MITVEMLMKTLSEHEVLEWRDRNFAGSHMTELIKPEWVVKSIWTDDDGILCVEVDADFTEIV